MFSKAPRFQPPPPSTTPGPNTYDPTEPQAHWKQGVFPDRPTTMSRRPIDEPAPAPHVSVVRRPLGPSTKANIIPSSAAASTLGAKSQLKLEDRLSKAEAKISDLQHEKVAAQNELGNLQTELRLAAQREAKLKLNIEKWEKSHASLKQKTSKLNDLQERLEELHKVHEESKARRQKEIDALTDKLKGEEERSKHRIAELKQAWTTEKRKAEEFQTKCVEVETDLKHLRAQGTASSDVLSDKERLIKELQADKVIALDAQKYARRIETELNNEIQQLKQQIAIKVNEAERAANEQQADSEAAKAKLRAELDELMEEMDELEKQHAHNLAVIAIAVSQQIVNLQEQSNEEKALLMSKWHSSASERIALETLADERAAQIRELVAVVKQVQDDRDAARALASTLQSDLDHITTELNAERELASAIIAGQEESRFSTSIGFEDDPDLSTMLNPDYTLDMLRSQIADLHSRNATVQEETDDLNSRLIARSLEAKNAEEALAAARTQVATLETSLAAKTREVGQLIAQLSELEPLRRRLATALSEAADAKKEAAAQTEAARSAQASLQNARVAEKAWRDERDRMATLLDQAEQYESLYHELATQTKHLVERNALAEEEKATLSALNSELLSHTNPMQKIMYMDRVRQELDAVKQENLALKLQLERTEEVNKQLEKELRGYKAVDVPLSQRPRADVTRVMRAADHVGLLRQVSGSEQRVQFKVATLPPSISLDRDMDATPVKSNFAMASKTPFSTHGPRFTAAPLQLQIQKTMQEPQRALEPESEEEIVVEEAELLPHPPLPVDTGLSPKKRRSYGNLSVHAAEEQAEEQAEDDTLLPLPQLDGAAEAGPTEKIKRNRPRHTLVNSGALRVGTDATPSTSSIPVAAPALKPAAANDAGAANRRPSLATSNLGIKARRVSELVRASTPPLPSIADFSSLETPNAHLLMDAALPSPSPYGLADWTATDETSHVPGLTRHLVPPIAHSTPLAPQARFRKSRYSGAQRVHSAADTSATPKMGPKRPSLVAVRELGGMVVEDEHDSFRKGWLYEGEDEHVELPDFSIEGAQKSVQAAKKQKTKLKGRNSAKVKPGPMARTFFR